MQSNYFYKKATLSSLVLASRQVLFLVISFFGIIFVLNLFGTTVYGQFATLFALHSILTTLCTVGITIFLTRRKVLVKKIINLCYSASLVFSLFIIFLCFYFHQSILSLISLNEFEQEFLALLFFTPLSVISAIAYSLLDKSFKFKEVMLSDILCLSVFYLSAMVLFHFNQSVKSLVFSLLLQQVLSTVIGLHISKFKPKPLFNKRFFKIFYISIIQISIAKLLVSSRVHLLTLFVSKYLGVDSVSVVTISGKIMEATVFIREVISRLSLPIFSLIIKKSVLVNISTNIFKVYVHFVGGAVCLGLFFIPYFTPLIFPSISNELNYFIPLFAVCFFITSLTELPKQLLYLKRKELFVLTIDLISIVFFIALAGLFIKKLGYIGIVISELSVIFALIGLLICCHLNQLLMLDRKLILSIGLYSIGIIYVPKIMLLLCLCGLILNYLRIKTFLIKIWRVDNESKHHY